MRIKTLILDLTLDLIFFSSVLFFVVLSQKEPLTLSLGLSVWSIGLLWIMENKKNIYFYLMMAVLGPLAEIVCVYMGVWSFYNPDFLGIPYWLPFFWGIIGLCLGDAYYKIINY